MIKDIFKEIKRLQQEMNNLIANFDREYVNVEENFVMPRMDLKESKDKLVAIIELPGVDKKDIKINLTETSLEVKVEKKARVSTKTENYIKEERGYKGFYRSMTLPTRIIPEKAKAEYKDGVLEIVMPKQEKEKKVKNLKVE